MTAPDHRFTYADGTGVCCAQWPVCVLTEITAQDSRLDQLTALLDQSAPMEAIVDFLSHDGITRTPSFGAMQVGEKSVRVVVHGSVRAIVDGTVIEAPQFLTETTVNPQEKVCLTLGTGEARLPITIGAALASCVEWAVGVEGESQSAQASKVGGNPEVKAVPAPEVKPEPALEVNAAPAPEVKPEPAPTQGANPDVKQAPKPPVAPPPSTDDDFTDMDLTAFDHLFGPPPPPAGQTAKVPEPLQQPIPAPVILPQAGSPTPTQDIPTPTPQPVLQVPIAAAPVTPIPAIPVILPQAGSPTPGRGVPTGGDPASGRMTSGDGRMASGSGGDPASGRMTSGDSRMASGDSRMASGSGGDPASGRMTSGDSRMTSGDGRMTSGDGGVASQGARMTEDGEDIGRTQIAAPTMSVAELVEDIRAMESEPGHASGFIDSFDWGPPRRAAKTPGRGPGRAAPAPKESIPAGVTQHVPKSPLADMPASAVHVPTLPPGLLPEPPATPEPPVVPAPSATPAVPAPSFFTPAVSQPLLAPPLVPLVPPVPLAPLAQPPVPPAPSIASAQPLLAAPPAPLAQPPVPPVPFVPPLESPTVEADFSGLESLTHPYPKPPWLKGGAQSVVPKENFEATVRKTSLDNVSGSGDVMVVAFRCANGHFSPPYATHCRVCGIGLDQTQQPLEVVRPPLGVLKLWAGGAILLDRGVIFGRNPHVVPGTAGPMPNLLKIEDPNRDVSSQHCWVRLEDWYVTVTDLNSTNGTQVILPHRAPLALRANDPVAIEPGTRVVLANAFDFVYEVA